MSDTFMVDDEELAGPHQRPPAADTEGMLDQLIDMITSAKSMPLSSSAIVGRDDALELLEKARDLLPEEIHRARLMLRERDDFHLKTRRDAEDILEEARVQAERMVQRTEIVRQASHRARRILEDAEADARRRRREADDFVDQKLGNFEIVLDRTLRMVRAGREKLAVDPFAAGAAAERAAASDAAAAAEDPDSLFDQDVT
jgi:F0F1-type ATP synthase membrane subunit b/b'